VRIFRREESGKYVLNSRSKILGAMGVQAIFDERSFPTQVNTRFVYAGNLDRQREALPAKKEEFDRG